MRRRFILLAACLLALALGTPARADIFVKIPGIPGDATATGHMGEIQVQALSFSGGQIVPKSGPKACALPKKTQISAISLTKLSDVASPKLVMAAAEGTIFPDVTITITDSSTAQDSLSYQLKNAFVSSYSVGASDGFTPTETISLAFTSLTFTKLDVSPPESAVWSFCGTSP